MNDVTREPERSPERASTEHVPCERGPAGRGAAPAPDPDLASALAAARACRLCAAHLPAGPRPVVQADAAARILIVGQAPGTRVHASGRPFDDPSGDRLRVWLGVGRDAFYDPARFAIVPMGLCYPGTDARGADKPPRPECAPIWQPRIGAHLPNVALTLLIGAYAQRFHLGGAARRTLTGTVRDWRAHTPDRLPLPHPSWRNTAWLKKNPWFEAEVVPWLRERVAELLA